MVPVPEGAAGSAAADDPAPFRVERPLAPTPVVVEVPHAGLHVDPETLAFTTRGPARAIARDADLFMDRLARPVVRAGATLLVARWSRWVCDLNRGPDDFDGGAVAGGGPAPRPRGVVWRVSTDGQPLFDAPLPASELERRLARVHRPYHEALRALVDEARARHGFALVLSAHSMPARAFVAGEPRPDLVPGSRGGTTADASVLRAVERCAQRAGLSLRHDDPYRGGHVTASLGRPAEGVHAVQLEVGRWLYVDEERNVLDAAGAARVSDLLASLAAALAELDPSRLRAGAARVA